MVMEWFLNKTTYSKSRLGDYNSEKYRIVEALSNIHLMDS